MRQWGEELALKSERLILRPLRREDLGALVKYRSDPEVARYQSWEAPYTLPQAEALLAEMEGRRPGLRGNWYQLGIERHQDEVFLGDIGFRVLAEDTAQAEIGFTLASAHQKQGYGAEAAGLLLRYLFENLALHRVRALCTAPNRASARLLERIGMRCEAHCVRAHWFKGAWVDQLWYAMLADEWRATSAVFGRVAHGQDNTGAAQPAIAPVRTALKNEEKA